MEKVEMEITKMGERGQLVIPKDIRDELGLSCGSAVELIKADGLIVMKKIEPSINKEDIHTLDRINNAWKEIEEGKGKRYTEEEFKKKVLSGKL
ncbi:MAG: AbrB/MazE/SpoVT family DNA-binding domain-containing protein [Candidatus Nanoarchaeia archaeon]|nr:AbrB/MazE/SpoVT family DNA-binding domain-containing protein [Candidatus Nanoarchaeia archaeon]MDD5239644.1 AbrB/MazE/SpoVT family DNA-binding domain-containing protein [Candidatus Nanoarchaeia archaeon]